MREREGEEMSRERFFQAGKILFLPAVCTLKLCKDIKKSKG